jgi:PIN domain nuclease of toxin-antitoxin system
VITHVLDTCALLDLTTERWSNPAAREELEQAEKPVLLAVFVREISRKFRLRKLRLPCELADLYEFLLRVCQHHQLKILSLDGETCHRAELLEAHHEDPTDRMILALATNWQVPVFNTDRRFEKYPVRVIRQW